MKMVWKTLVGVALVAGLFCLARVIMYGVGSLPFMDSFKKTQTQAGSEVKPSGAASDPGAGRASSSSNPPAQTYQASPPPPARTSGQGAGQPSSVPNPPSMYERARRAGNRPNNGQDE